MIKIFLFLSILFFSFNSYSTSVVVINIEKIINENESYIKEINKIELSQKKYLDEFKIKEIKLDKKIQEIENSKLILEESEINNLILNYNNELNEYNDLIDKFNTHYNNQIINIRNIILEELIILIEKYIKNNNIELVLDSNNYLIASNAINITIEIANDLKKVTLNLDFIDFEKN